MENYDQVVQMLNDSISTVPNREIGTASGCLLLAALNICEDAVACLAHYLKNPEEDRAEYMALDQKKAMYQIQRILGVLAELEGLEDHSEYCQ